MTKEALKLALEALENSVDLVREDAYNAEELYGNYPARQGKVRGLKVLADDHEKAITAIKEALANEALDKMAENARELGLDYEPEQEPVAWLLTDKNINSLQVDSIQRLIDRLKHAHHTDLCVRINGQDEWFQADWLKHMVRATPPQRTWVNATTWRGLTDDEILSISADCASSHQHMDIHFARAIEAKLKAKNLL